MTSLITRFFHHRGEEIMVWYGDEYGKELNIEPFVSKNKSGENSQYGVLFC